MATFLFSGCFNSEDNSVSALPDSSSEMREDSSSGAFGNSESPDISDSSQSMHGGQSVQDGNSHSGASSSGHSNSLDDSQSGMSSSESTSAKVSAFTQEAIEVFTSTQQNWNMMLVNAQNPLPEGFAIELVEVDGFDDRLFDARAVQSLEDMLDDAAKAGVQLYLVSAYRSPERQATLYRNKVDYYKEQGYGIAKAEELAAMWVAKEYTSEHNLGLAVDLVSADWYSHNDDLTEEFEDTPHFDWLVENCTEYGFILRYPKEKVHLTGVNYEPWHYRYVGAEDAKKIMDSNVTLEEYLL